MIFRTSRPPNSGGFLFNKKQGRRKMKNISKLCMVGVPAVACMIASPALGISISICSSRLECLSSLKSGCCCPTGKTEPIYSCPTGWTAGSDGICTRFGVSTSDDNGYYLASYGTCTATPNGTKECWEMSFSQTSPECMCTSSELDPIGPGL